uniref:Uncharacterized protein n=1 Tax=Nelumbo nucifera TaxID=4432 RepID=A0A822YS34_NELNU|nr:TPA_asm: hypothetical protein HUJ06_004859 [Nelumbo nucifera]
MWTPIATIKIVSIQKYIMACTRMEIPLVHMFPNSTILVLAGNWKRSPGDSSMKSITETTTGPQSAAILFSFFLSFPLSRIKETRVLDATT